MSQQAPSIPPFAALLQIICAQWEGAAIGAAAKYGIADQLETGPKTTPELATRLNLHEDSLYRVLRALAGLGIFHEGENRTFSQTPLSDLLRTNARPSLRHVAASWLDNWHWRSIQGICSTVENGRTGAANVLGAELFDYLGAHPDEALSFNRCMTDLSSGEAPAVMATYDFSGFEHIVDVAGGAGRLLAAILASVPELRGTLFDQPSVIEQAKSDAILAPFADRCQLIGGDFFEAVPAGVDAYIMKHIIHDWDDERAAKILKNCRRGLKPGGKLLVVDRVIGPPNTPDPKKFFDIAMMLMPGGRERSETEWNALYASAGFRVTRIMQTPAPHSIIEGVPA
jgi:SAM-dependent methyltransferase